MKIDDATITELGMQDLSPELREVAFLKYYEIVTKQIGFELSQKLSDEQMDAFQALAEKDDPEATQAWLTENVPDYEEMTTRITKEVAADIRKSVEDTKQHQQKHES